MTRIRPSLVAVLLVVGAVAVAGVGPTALGGESQMDEQSGNGSSETAPTGAFVASVVGMEEATVDTTVQVARFETRLSAAESDAERAAVIATVLNRSRSRVMMLENRLAMARMARENGTMNDQWFAVETSWLRSSAENQRRLARRLERAAEELPREQRAAHGVTVAAIDRLQERVDRLLASEAPRIHRTSFDREFYRDVGRLADRFDENDEGHGLGVLGEHVDGERVNLHVVPENGTETVVSFRTTEDGRITDLRAGERPDATVDVWMNGDTARAILAADRPARVAATAYVRGEIQVSGIGIGERVAWTVRAAILVVFRTLVDLAGGVGGVG